MNAQGGYQMLLNQNPLQQSTDWIKWISAIIGLAILIWNFLLEKRQRKTQRTIDNILEIRGFREVCNAGIEKLNALHTKYTKGADADKEDLHEIIKIVSDFQVYKIWDDKERKSLSEFKVKVSDFLTSYDNNDFNQNHRLSIEIAILLDSVNSIAKRKGNII